MAPLLRISIGIVVERSKANSPWCEFIWRPIAVLGGIPDVDPWSQLASEEEAVTFYVGAAEIELYRTETEHYRNNLVSAAPSVWVALLSTAGAPRMRLPPSRRTQRKGGFDRTGPGIRARRADLGARYHCLAYRRAPRRAALREA
jgi:hypothetical protein